MKNVKIENGEIQALEIALWCMRIADLSIDDISNLIVTACTRRWYKL